MLTHMIANKFVGSDSWAKQSPLNRGKHAAVLCIAIKEFENIYIFENLLRILQYCKKKKSLTWFICSFISININT